MKKQLFINGEWIGTESYKDLLSPYNNEKIAEIASATEEDVDKAIAAAYQTNEIMAEMPAHQRASILERVANLIEERADEVLKSFLLKLQNHIKPHLVK